MKGLCLRVLRPPALDLDFKHGQLADADVQRRYPARLPKAVFSWIDKVVSVGPLHDLLGQPWRVIQRQIVSRIRVQQ